MEFNETSSVSSLLLSKSILKVSDNKNVFSSKDTARDVRVVLFYWGSFLVEGDPSNENVGPSSLENENGGENRSSFFVLVGRKHRPEAKKSIPAESVSGFANVCSRYFFQVLLPQHFEKYPSIPASIPVVF